MMENMVFLLLGVLLGLSGGAVYLVTRFQKRSVLQVILCLLISSTAGIIVTLVLLGGDPNPNKIVFALIMATGYIGAGFAED